MNRKPMLATDCGPLEELRFPLVASTKLDGVRAIKGPSRVLSRSLKSFPNQRLQALYDGVPDGLDGEFTVGPPNATDVYRRTMSVVMSDDVPIDELVWRAFDVQEDNPWEERLARLERLFEDWTPWKACVSLVHQVTVASLAELLTLENDWVSLGYEGVILRKPGSPYKHGRSTQREGYLLKLKRFADSEAEVIGVTELMHNGNEAKTNELGRTGRGHKKAGMVGTGTLGALQVRDAKTGVEFEIGTGFTAQDRVVLWTTWQMFGVHGFGLAKYKHFPIGAKDKPRHPVFLGWRDSLDT